MAMTMIESLMQTKREIMAPLTYERTKRARLQRSLDPLNRQVRFSELNTEVIFDLCSAPKMIQSRPNPSLRECRENLQFLTAAGSSNIHLRMELLGSRIFSVEELDNLLAGPELGFQTLCHPDDVDGLDTMSAQDLPMILKALVGHSVLVGVALDSIRDKLKVVYLNDLERAQERRRELIDYELVIRNVTPTIYFKHNVELLRRAIKKEDEIAQLEDGVLVELYRNIETLTYNECLDKLESFRQSAAQNVLRAVGLAVDGSIQDQERRLEIFFQIRQKALLSALDFHPQDLSQGEIVQELENRRIRIPFGANNQFLVKILTNALAGELTKAPIKFPFGVSAVTLDDLDDLSPETLRNMLVEARGCSSVEDIDIDSRDLLLHRLRTMILQRNNDAYVKAIRGVLRQLKCFQEIADLDDDHKADWTKWFSQLEICMEEQHIRGISENIEEIL